MPKPHAQRTVTLGFAVAALAIAVETIAAPLAIAPAPGIRLQSYHAYGSFRRQTVAMPAPATFAIPVENARERFRAWLGSGNWLRPGDLTVAARGIQLQ